MAVETLNPPPYVPYEGGFSVNFTQTFGEITGQCISWCEQQAYIQAHNELLFGLMMPVISYLAWSFHHSVKEAHLPFNMLNEAQAKATQKILLILARGFFYVFVAWGLYHAWFGMFSQ